MLPVQKLADSGHDKRSPRGLAPSDISEAIALLTVYGCILGGNDRDEYLIRLLNWAVAVLRQHGYSQVKVDFLIADRDTLQAKWWMLRQFIPAHQIVKLVEQLRPLVEQEYREDTIKALYRRVINNEEDL